MIDPQGRRTNMSDVVGKPKLTDKLKPDLGGKIVEAIIDDNERVRRAREDKRKRAEDERRAKDDA